DQISREMRMGFDFKGDALKARTRDYDLMRDKVLSELKQAFRPEFLNRIDASIVFHSLTAEQIRQIVDLELKRVRTQLAEQDISLEVTIDAMDLLADRGYDQTYGARPLRRIIQNLIEDPLAEGLLDSRFHSNSTIRVEVEEDLLKLSAVEELAVVS
ncbi:MAG: NDP-hexose 4-ketoreductase, partial [Thermomicrobiales bacterium]